jgi:hypothetical protein
LIKKSSSTKDQNPLLEPFRENPKRYDTTKLSELN